MRKRKKKKASGVMVGNKPAVDFSSLTLDEDFEDSEKMKAEDLLGVPLVFVLIKEMKSTGTKFKSKKGRAVKGVAEDSTWHLVLAKILKKNKYVRFNASGVLSRIFADHSKNLPFTGKLMKKKAPKGSYFQIVGLKG